MSRIKLLLMIPHLGGGGAERVTAMLAEHLDPARFDMHLAVLTPDAPGSEPLSASVTVHRMNAKRVRSAAFKILQLIRHLQPQIVLSNMVHLNMLVLLLKPLMPASTKILVRQNAKVFLPVHTFLQNATYRWLYPKADRIICQSRSMAEDFLTKFSIPPDQLVILANPISQMVANHHQVTRQPKLLLAVGRLSQEKGFDLLLRALALISTSHPEANLTIAGIGTEAANLNQLTHELKITHRVCFAGHQSNLGPHYAQASLFVLPSRHEGMPNALLEAAAAGLPLVTTPCCQGVVDLLKDAAHTWVARAITAESLAEAILSALQAPPDTFVEHAFLAPFERSTAIHAYQTLLLEVAGQQTSSAQPECA